MKYILILLLILTSCQSYRAERKISKLKEWGYLKDSTITKYDTLRGFTLDSVYLFDTTTILDTITRIENGLKITTVIKWKQREVRQIVSQKDTIFEHKFQTKVIKQPINWWNRFKIGLIFGIILTIAIFYLTYKFNKV
jgi:hypothetical protein